MSELTKEDRLRLRVYTKRAELVRLAAAAIYGGMIAASLSNRSQAARSEAIREAERLADDLRRENWL